MIATAYENRDRWWIGPEAIGGMRFDRSGETRQNAVVDCVRTRSWSVEGSRRPLSSSS